MADFSDWWSVVRFEAFFDQPVLLHKLMLEGSLVSVLPQLLLRDEYLVWQEFLPLRLALGRWSPSHLRVEVVHVWPRQPLYRPQMSAHGSYLGSLRLLL